MNTLNEAWAAYKAQPLGSDAASAAYWHWRKLVTAYVAARVPDEEEEASHAG